MQTFFWSAVVFVGCLQAAITSFYVFSHERPSLQRITAAGSALAAGILLTIIGG